MSGTQYTEDDKDEGSDIYPLQLVDPAEDVGRRRRVSFSEPKGKEVQTRTWSPSPPEFSEEDFKEMMEEILEGIRRRRNGRGRQPKKSA